MKDPNLADTLRMYGEISNLRLRVWHHSRDHWVDATVRLNCGRNPKYVAPQLAEQLCMVLRGLAGKADLTDPQARTEIVESVGRLLRSLEERT